ncbi:MAG: hypothetical protein GX626_02020 [Spirochaetales bacterium]|nr:hypothetical protein [Spirochaetales bacterium]
MKRKKPPKPGRMKPMVLVALLLLILVLLSLPFVLWLLTPRPNLAVTVYDKSVATSKAEQHQNLGWFLSHNKFPTEGGKPFRTQSTYLGYHPKDENPIRDLSTLDERTDLLYIADTYGVYKSGEGFSRTLAEGESNLIWGGSSYSDVQAIKAFLNRESASTVVAEYNTFATPTPSYVQAQLYEVLGTRWTGWTGMYVNDLSKGGETPPWILDLYSTSWNYTGSGILLYNTDDEIVVLRSGIELGPGQMTFSYTERGEDLLGLSGSTAYRLLFDITEPLAGTEVLATYTLDVNEEGRQMLESFGLSSTFPAVQLKQTANHRAYYLGGNWAYSQRTLKLFRLKGLSSLLEAVASGERAFFWKFYMPMLTSIFDEARQRKTEVVAPLGREVATIGSSRMISRTNGRNLELYQDGSWKPYFVYGMNLGIAMPGRWFTEFPQDKSLYYHWLEQMGKLGVNTLRIYTLLDPQFYQAFSLYNRMHPDRPIYLLQEVWPEEEPPGHDYLEPAYQKAFEEEIINVVDAIHGKADIPERKGRAYGVYETDVSSFVLGYLVGRELEPHEVEQTDINHSGYRFKGRYISTTDEATPTESWLAQSCDYLLSYEEATYGWQHPVSIVNWPTLDYLDHESERNENGEKIREYNDRTTVNINHLLVEADNQAGLFGSYHIYPNYPDFMNNEPSFDAYEDEQGRLRYGGYLQAFMEGHQNYPALVAEFGIATGMGNAHYSPDGYHHGGLTEGEQAQGIIRMFEAMKDQGYSGGIIFEWMDEWAKKTWTTEPYMVPYDRQILWHNAIDPEQNYGILAYEAVKPSRSGASSVGDGLVQRMEVRADASFLHVDISLARPIDFQAEQLLIGIDTLYRDRGELTYAPLLDHLAPSGMEYLVVLDSFEASRLLALKEANYTAYRFSTSTGLRTAGLFEPMRKLINKERKLLDGTVIHPKYEDASLLRFGSLEGNTNHWTIEGTALSVRIPWTRINVSDVSSAQVLDDERTYYSDPLRDQIATTTTDGLVVSAVVVDPVGQRVIDAPQAATLVLSGWNQPVYRQRLKASYDLLKAYFAKERADD